MAPRSYTELFVSISIALEKLNEIADTPPQTSPVPVYKSTRDTRNTPLWNPSNARMANVEEDEAGRLRAFRRRFGRSFDSAASEPQVQRQEESAPDDEATRHRETNVAESKHERKTESPSVPTAGVVPNATGEPADAVKSQDGAALHDAGAETFSKSGMDDADDDGDNLMDLLSSYAAERTGRTEGGSSARVVQRGGGESGGRGKGKKR